MPSGKDRHVINTVLQARICAWSFCFVLFFVIFKREISCCGQFLILKWKCTAGYFLLVWVCVC